MTPRVDLNAEASVLGSIMLRPDKYAEAAEYILDYKYFYDSRHRLIWLAMQEMIMESKTIDYITLSEQLAQKISSGDIDPVYFTRLTDIVPSPEYCGHYAKIVAEEWRARELTKNAIELKTRLDNREDETALDAWGAFYGKSQAVLTGADKKELPSIMNLAVELGAIKEGQGWGTPWGIIEFDQNFHEIAPGAIIVLGGRPGHNKTAMALQLLDGWLRKGKRVLFHSLEMNWREINMRRLSRLTSIPAWRIKRGSFYRINLADADYEQKIDKGVKWIYGHEKTLILNDSSGLTPQQLALSIRLAHEKEKLDFVVIDHFGLVKFDGKKEERFLRDEGLQCIVTACKSRGICCLLLAQLNRSIEREDRQDPKLSDLREVGGLEEIATNVLFTVWPYKFTNDENDLHRLRIFQCKARDGNTGKIELWINAETYTMGVTENDKMA
jgi:replicative DNA helicase